MTAQILDVFRFKGQKFSLIGRKGTSLFSPIAYGFRPTAMSTGCYRGFYCDYDIQDDMLLLTHLVINNANKKYPTFAGVTPLDEEPRILTSEEVAALQPLTGRYIGYSHKAGDASQPLEAWLYYDGAIYVDLKLPIAFTGGIVLGTTLIHKGYIYMGLQRPMAFKHVVELLFEDGRITRQIDHSEELAALRDQMQQTPLTDYNDPTQRMEEMQEWITERFSLDYDFWRLF